MEKPKYSTIFKFCQGKAQFFILAKIYYTKPKCFIPEYNIGGWSDEWWCGGGLVGVMHKLIKYNGSTAYI